MVHLVLQCSCIPRVITVPYMYIEERTIHRPSHSIFFCMCSSSNRPVFFYNRKAKNLLNRICEEGKIPESLVRDISFNKHDILLLNQQGQLLLLGQGQHVHEPLSLLTRFVCFFLLLVLFCGLF